MGVIKAGASAPYRVWLTDRLGPVGTISIAQLFGTSLWFSANSAAQDLMRTWHASAADIGWLTSAVQLGFILGTLLVSLTGAADRFTASSIFVFSAIVGAVFNACFALLSHSVVSGGVFRFLVGVCLAGIYPMGMKLIISWAPKRTGSALAQLVAMLTLGSALPHALRGAGASLPWQEVIVASSALSMIGGLLIHLLGDGPHLRRSPRKDNEKRPSVASAFRSPAFRAAAYGYFGHMWELYAFWTVVPLFVARTSVSSVIHLGGVSGLSFIVIGVGAVGCIAGGLLTKKVGSARVAAAALLLSGGCSVVFAASWRVLPPVILLTLLLVWGAAVIADSPQFSAISAKACAPELVGSALAIQNSIGFAITVVSISGVTWLFERVGLDSSWLLVVGPVAGLIGFSPLLRAQDRALD